MVSLMVDARSTTGGGFFVIMGRRPSIKLIEVLGCGAGIVALEQAQRLTVLVCRIIAEIK